MCFEFQKLNWKLVGLVIGKGGETIISIQAQSKAKVYLAADPSNADRPTKTLNISGSQAEIDLAKKLINDVLGSVFSLFKISCQWYIGFNAITRNTF